MRLVARRSQTQPAGIGRRILPAIAGATLVFAGFGVASAAPVFSAKASVQPLVQYLGDATGTTFTFTIDNTGDVGIGAVDIVRPSTSWTILACPLAPSGWSTQRADTKCRYRSADTTVDDIAGHTSSGAFQVTASVVPGSQDIAGTWSVTVSSSNQFDKPSKVKSAASEPPGLTIRAYSFQILDAVIVDSAPVPRVAPARPRHLATTAPAPARPARSSRSAARTGPTSP